METNETSQFAEYKGRKYKLLFLGDTKFGKRAQLAFLDGSKKFWVPANLINNSNIPEANNEPSATSMPFGKYRNKAFTEIPTEYLEWLIKRDNLKEPLRTNVAKELSGRDDRSNEIDDSDIPF